MEWWNGPSKEQEYMAGAIAWIGGLLLVVSGAALLYQHILSQIVQALR